MMASVSPLPPARRHYDGVTSTAMLPLKSSGGVGGVGVGVGCRYRHEPYDERMPYVVVATPHAQPVDDVSHSRPSRPAASIAAATRPHPTPLPATASLAAVESSYLIRAPPVGSRSPVALSRQTVFAWSVLAPAAGSRRGCMALPIGGGMEEPWLMDLSPTWSSSSSGPSTPPPPASTAVAALPNLPHPLILQGGPPVDVPQGKKYNLRHPLDAGGDYDRTEPLIAVGGGAHRLQVGGSKAVNATPTEPPEASDATAAASMPIGPLPAAATLEPRACSLPRVPAAMMTTPEEAMQRTLVSMTRARIVEVLRECSREAAFTATPSPSCAWGSCSLQRLQGDIMERCEEPRLDRGPCSPWPRRVAEGGEAAAAGEPRLGAPTLYRRVICGAMFKGSFHQFLRAFCGVHVFHYEASHVAQLSPFISDNEGRASLEHDAAAAAFVPDRAMVVHLRPRLLACLDLVVTQHARRPSFGNTMTVDEFANPTAEGPPTSSPLSPPASIISQAAAAIRMFTCGQTTALSPFATGEETHSAAALLTSVSHNAVKKMLRDSAIRLTSSSRKRTPARSPSQATPAHPPQ